MSRPGRLATRTFPRGLAAAWPAWPWRLALRGFSGFSTTISSAGLSSRRPWNDAWRILPPLVQERNSISATSSGFTQTTPFSLAAAPEKGEASAFSASSFCLRSAGDLAGKAGADMADRLQLAALVIADHQRADAAAGLLRRQIAGDDEFLAQRAFRLHPVVAAAAAIGRVGALGDDAFEPHAAGMLQHHLAGLGKMLAEAQRRIARRGPPSRSRSFSLRSTSGSRRDVLAIEPQQIEDIVDQTVGAAVGERAAAARRRTRRRCRPSTTISPSMTADRACQAGQAPRRSRLPKLSRPVETGAGVEPDLGAGELRLHAIAVELHLVQPFVAGGRLLLEPCQAWRRTAASMDSPRRLAVLALALPVGRLVGLPDRWLCLAVRLPSCLSPTSSIVRPDFTDSGASSRMSSLAGGGGRRRI